MTPKISFRRFLAALLAAACCTAGAQPAGVDYSDLWWNPSQNGWGLALQRQGDVMFAALYVYDAAGKPTWFVASDVRPAAGGTAWSGALYRVSAPPLTAPFDGRVVVAPVGTLAVSFEAASSGRLEYSVDGAAVASPIERMTWRTPSIAGSYHGGFSTLASQCRDPNMDGMFQLTGPVSVGESGSATTLRVDAPGLAGEPSNCTLTGVRAQSGRLGAIEGAFSCSIFTGLDVRGESPSIVRRLGTFRIERLAVTANGFSGALTAEDQDCRYAGQVGGVRRP